MDYVTIDQLGAVLGASAQPERAQLAVDAANYLVALWCPPPPVTDPPTPPATVPTPAQSQAGLELANSLYHRQAAPGGLTSQQDLIAQLPADVVRGVRDLLDADSGSWGLA